MMRKVYGESQVSNCPFCGNMATVKNEQGIPVCQNHKNKRLEDIKCACGEWLDIRTGKWGPYFVCMNCGNISFRKGMEMAAHKKREITITSDQVDTVY